MDFVLFGIQGSGKGTQAKKLVEEFRFTLFEAGGELRRIAASGTPLGKTVSEYIDHGHLVPHEIIMQVVKDAVSAHKGTEALLFDGIPRDTDQQRDFDVIMSSLNRPFRCIRLVVDEEAALRRILKRAQEQGRADDANEEFIRRRMGLFHQKTEPVIDAYAARGLVSDADGEGTVDEVYARVREAVLAYR